MDNIKVKVVDCHVVYWEGDIPQYLTIQRSRSERYPLVWQCITGGIKNNEKIFEAAIRELKEETNLNGKFVIIILQSLIKKCVSILANETEHCENCFTT